MKKNKAFTLIEVLAVIVVLAIIALIAVPNINGYIKRSQETKFDASVDSLIKAYRYKQIDEGDNIGRISACSLDVEKCNIIGYVEKCESNICIHVTDGRYCAIGTADNYVIKEGNCTNNDPNNPSSAPVINNITITNITVSSADVLVTFTEPNFVVSHKYRLLDKNGNVVVDWTSGDSINNVNVQKSSLKKFTSLEKGTQYTVEVEIVNNNDTDNTATSSKTFTTLSFNAPTIAYDTSKWETSKTVTITYPSLTGIERRYMIKTNKGWDTSGIQNADIVQTVTISNYQYIVEAIASSGSSNLSTSSVIGYVDNELDENNTKSTSEALNYKNSNGINTNQISLRLQDTKSGIAYYCVSTQNDSTNCSGTGNNTELNKWVLAVTNASDLGKANKEVRDRTVQHQFADAGTYYVFVKDAVGNISDSNKIVLYKVEYDLNGGTGTVNYQIKLHGNDVVLSDVTPTRSGYVFLGWDKTNNRNDGSVGYAKKGTYKDNSNVKLYAIWRKTVTITYNSNSGTGSVASVSCYRYNAEPTCPIAFDSGSALSRTGYTFEGWAKGQHNYAVAYNKSQSYNIAESETVYAGWKAKELTWTDQSFTKEYNNSNQIINITQATNGNNATAYTKISEKQGTTNTTRISVNSSNGALTVSGETPVAQYKVVVKASLPVSNTIDGVTEVTVQRLMTVTINPFTIPELDPDDPNNTAGTGLKIADISAVIYKHAEHKPEPVVTVVTTKGASPKTLVKGTDFDYSYSNNTNVGTATVKITLKGNYSGNKPKNFTINPYNVSNVDITSVTAVIYKHAAYTPEPTVTAFKGQNNAETMVKGTDFTYSYSNNTNAGTATITITGKGNYTGTKSINFTINPYNVSNVTIADVAAVVFKNAVHTPEPTVTAFKGQSNAETMVKGTDFTYSYSNNTNVGTATITITGKGNYTGTNTKNFTINAYNMSGVSIADVAAVTYKHAAHTPEPAVTASSINKTLAKETDFTYSYTNNINKGTATITVTGKGNFTGTNTKTFTINAYDVSNVDIASISAVTYKGSNHTPETTITAFKGQSNAETMVKGTDFTYSYLNNKNAGTATITITGKGNYTGTKSANFTINKKSVAVVWSNTSLTYNNANQKPTATVDTGITGETMTLSVTGEKKAVGTNYSATTSCNTVTNSSCDNYIVTNTSTTFSISAYNMSNVTIDSVSDKVYSGSPYTPEPIVTATAISQTLVKGTDFTYSYANNKDKGTATITVTGKGNFTGTKTQTFKITAADPVVDITCASLTYNGTTQGLMSVTSISNRNLYYSMTTQLTASNYSTSGTSIAADSPKATEAGSYTIYWYAPEDNYKAYSKTTTCTIAKKDITITANAQTVTYGTAITQGTDQITQSGLISGHSITAVTLTQNTSNYTLNGTITPSALTIKKNNTDVTSNYNITYKTGKLVVNKKAVTITANAQTVTYGTAITQGTDKVTQSGLISGHSITAVTLTQSTTNYTTNGTITPSGATIKSGSTDVTSNYSISYANGTLKVNQKAVTITANAQTVNYGTAITQGTSKISQSGLLSGHSVTDITLTASTSNVPGGTITPSGAVIKVNSTDVTSNYSISYASGSLTINKVNAVCPSLTAYSGTYDASAHYITVSGGQGGTIQYRTSTTASWGNSNISRTDQGETTIYVQVAGDGNHNTVDCGYKKISIAKKNVTITAKAQTVNYGTAITQGTGQITQSGLISGHSVSSVTLTASTGNAPGGVITPSGATIVSGSIDVTGNYNITYSNGTLTINKVNAVCPSLTAYSGTYDASAHYITVSGGQGGTIQYRTSTTASWGNSNISRTDQGETTIYVQVAGDGNHNTVDCGYKKISIAKKNVTITAKAQTVNYGTAITQGTGQITQSGLISGHSVSSVTLTASTGNAPGGVITPSGATIVSGSTNITENYNITYSNGALTINKVNAVCPTVTAYSGNYDGAAHSVGISGGQGGTIQYRTSTANAWSNTKPTLTNAGSINTYVQVAGDGNHNTVDCGYKAVTINALNLSGSVTITGTNKVGQTLTASVSNPNGASLSYQWFYATIDNGTQNWHAISGATGGTYVISNSLIGYEIAVMVYASKANYNNASWQGNTTDANGSRYVLAAIAYKYWSAKQGGSGTNYPNSYPSSALDTYTSFVGVPFIKTTIEGATVTNQEVCIYYRSVLGCFGTNAGIDFASGNAQTYMRNLFGDNSFSLVVTYGSSGFEKGEVKNSSGYKITRWSSGSVNWEVPHSVAHDCTVRNTDVATCYCATADCPS